MEGTNHLLWQPKHPEESRMWDFLCFAAEKAQKNFNTYQQLYAWSIQDRALFWQTLCEFFKLKFNTPPEQILNDYKEIFTAQWFKGARFNFAEQLLARRDSHLALISINENGERQTLTYEQLYQAVASCIAGLKASGITAGDRVAAIMPNVPYTIIAMLATTAIGAIWSSCSPDFGVQALVDRLSQIKPKLIFICDGHQYGGKKHEAQSKINQLREALSFDLRFVICPIINAEFDLLCNQHTQLWSNFIQPSSTCEFIPQPFAHPLYILFSSGTTGKPKCIVHGAGGTLLQHLKELALHSDLNETDNLCFYTTCGWMMWNWMVSALALGTTLTLYEGSPTYPETGRLFRLIEEEKITVFGTSAKFLSTVEKEAIYPIEQFNLNSLRLILSTGSPLLPQNCEFVYQKIKTNLQLSSISGGTDIISCFALGNPLLPVYSGELQCLGLGMAVKVFNEQGKAVEQERGELVCTQPFPSMPLGFWQDSNNERYKQAYFERFPNTWAHGDFAEISSHQGLIIYGRSDATLNPGGVRIGTAEIYRQVEKIPEILDSLVIGQEWNDDTRIVLFVKLKDGISLDETLIKNIRQLIRQQASPRHVPAKILAVNDIPKTISGKIVELAVREIVHNRPVYNLEALANPEALDYFKNRIELSN